MKMETILYKVEDIKTIAEVIKSGGMIAFPTDTVYGLAIDSGNLKAIDNLKIAKGRPEEKPFPMMVSSFDQLFKVAKVTEQERKVMEAFMPGALTIIFDKQDDLPVEVTNGFSTVGIRMPDDRWVLDLIDLVGKPLLVPSANLSGEASCVSHQEVLAQLDGRIDGVVLGKSGALQASTIIDLRNGDVKIIRQGAISLDQIRGILQ